MTLVCEQGGELAPESKAAVLAEVIRFIATRIEPVAYEALLSHIIKHFETDEPTVSLHVMRALLELCATGFASSNTYHHAPERGEQWLIFEADTTIGPTRKLTTFIYGQIE
ncbi:MULTISPECIES: hypothetical protein [unclassified Rhizobium]|uniref:hypothetical protein n=1 Tax=unclassified Rhizobium TaxID=2613769 RepID=UPI0007156797|nr:MULTISPECIES: hypothetical protein [unclassified Rhizobium]KQT03182.1 hypothetical protein ASG42_24540 [Rhizobium sp. Leaf391]KQU08423.1 hypothetical protein ASG68_22820 [Rhizobium sp. Leaf453]